MTGLSPGECRIYWADPADEQPWHERLLSEGERARRASLRRAEDRARQTVAAALLRLLAGRHLDERPSAVRVERACTDCAVPHGRPSVPGGLDVSVSHSGDRIAVVLSLAGPVGVDVEQAQPQRDILGVARLALSEAEIAASAPLDQDGFYTYWTRKESVLKATGDGLRVAMTKIEVSTPAQDPRLHRFDGRPDVVAAARMFTLAPGAGYQGALTVLGTPSAVTEHDGSALLRHQAEGL
ncbi:4'-phosphopantetheinyl transferase [Catellatospora methionotrophica]|uniref:4'-phosphopantetheinyl transferase n=1 Tax=Catellatospora methionotrophica TaxID=121620 RepID=A0A8J3L5U9_9ACTN|nr:4'-phosphopantetheinyl transferase superfamily protein [Catellatospora methionotrophica]GIG12667.1 4'-phosphopantetheinyl transferase [Catellatospora methionotrophica]